MIDLSTTEEEKGRYVTAVHLKEDSSNYVVTYADGHEEEHPFTIHNFNAEIYRMRDQFFAKKDRYMETLTRLCVKSVGKEVKTLLLSLIGIVFTVSIPLPVVLKIITVLLIILFDIFKILSSKVERGLLIIQMLGIENTEKYIEMMDKFKIDVTNPHNGEKEEWFMYSLNEVGPETNVDLLRFIAEKMPEQMKQEEGGRLSEHFKEIYERQLAEEKGKTK
ncbi:MAG: hypothetical protein II625_03275 [Bacilli bacterium]|nr:hypothetical protein [Bacilli bacterium]